jgi:hypothetical protein
MSQNQKDYGASVGASLDYNNTFMPPLSDIEFSTFAAKDGKGRSVLRTKVTFADGTFVRVVNSAGDKIEVVKAVQKRKPKTVKETQPDGKVVKKTVPDDLDLDVLVASDADKERAVLYALCKRLVGKAEKGGEVKAQGFSGKLRKLVADAIDTNVADRLLQLETSAAKEKAAKKAAKAKARREKLAAKAAEKETRIDRLVGAVEKLAETVAAKTGN